MEFEDRAKPNSVRFVLLQHTLPDHSSRKSHWDLMIEAGDFLLTFELQSLPGNVSNSARVAWPTTRLADHRRHYLDYEGVIDPPAQTSSDNKDTNKQAGNRGKVHRIAAGQAICQASQTSGPVHCQLHSAELTAEFHYIACRVGQATQLHIDSWHWTQHSRPEN
ncbi:MAG: hypothetical protein IT422_11555 [Pirellulaceae bacterium]|nr:hypothetical protein [Pirellulaceae bacterium]